MQDGRYRILLVEDDWADRMALERTLKENASLCVYTTADSVAQARTFLSSQKFDVVVTDYNLTDGTAMDVIPLVRDIPVIFVTGNGTEEVAVKALQAGAYDYLIKDNERHYLKMLLVIVERSMDRKRAEEQVKTLSQAVKNIGDCVCITDPKGRIIFTNEAFCRTYGYSEKEALQLNGRELWEGELSPEHAENWASGLSWQAELVHKRKDGSSFPVSYLQNSVEKEAPEKSQVVRITRDITERRNREEEREALICELKDALSQVKKLSGMLPICCSCKNIRDDKGYWNQIENYIADHSEADFSHGMCPDCFKKMYPSCAHLLDETQNPQGPAAVTDSREKLQPDGVRPLE